MLFGVKWFQVIELNEWDVLIVVWFYRTVTLHHPRRSCSHGHSTEFIFVTVYIMRDQWRMTLGPRRWFSWVQRAYDGCKGSGRKQPIYQRQWISIMRPENYYKRHQSIQSRLETTSSSTCITSTSQLTAFNVYPYRNDNHHHWMDILDTKCKRLKGWKTVVGGKLQVESASESARRVELLHTIAALQRNT